MKNISVEIVGVTPLLMNSPKNMVRREDKPANRTTEVKNIKDEAEGKTYRLSSNGNLFLPAQAVYSAMVYAAGAFRIGRKSASQILAGTITIKPIEIDLGMKTYDIDVRRCVIQRAGILVARPKIEKWGAKFTIEYDERFIDSKMIRQILEDAGVRMGLLDYRPQRRGMFGKFKVEVFKDK
jgi:hypothetical protein